jgi:hypothetical protein
MTIASYQPPTSTGAAQEATPAVPVGPGTGSNATTVGPAGTTSTIGNTSGASALGGTVPLAGGEQPPGTATPPTDVNAPGTITQVSLDPSIAAKPLPGGDQLGATAAQPAQKYNEQELVKELASALKVKATGGQTLEAAVIDKLASKYGVKIQGELVPPSPEKLETQRAAALKIKSPVLRQQALNKLNQQTATTGHGQGAVGKLRHDIAGWFDDALRPLTYMPALPGLGSASTTEAAPTQSKNALLDMLGEVGLKLGVNTSTIGQTGVQQVLSAAANQAGVPTGTAAMPGTAGGQQTAGQAWVAFQKQAFTGGSPNGALTTEGKTWATDLENSGYLDKNANNAAPSSAQVAQAYSSLVTDSVNNNVSVNQQMQNKAAAATAATGPTSEMQAFTQGVAEEFGVFLTPQQTTAIANEFGSTALTAANPSSVEDEIKNAVLQFYDPTNPNNPSGVANTMYVDIQQAAQEYQIPISAANIGNMVKTSLQSATVESMYVAADSATNAAIQQFQQQAMGLYPTLATQIQAGYKVSDLVAPYNQITQEYTGVPAATIQQATTQGGLTKYSNFLQGGTDPKTGTPTLQTMDQWKKTLMQDPQYGFQKTQGAIDMAEQLSSAILNEFGKVNTTGSANAFNQYSPTSDLNANTT